MCAGCEHHTKGSEIILDLDGKLKCGDYEIKPCSKLNDAIVTLFKMACQKVAMYTVDKLGASNASGPVSLVLPSTTYTVPTGMGGKYEVDYTVDITMPGNVTTPYSQAKVYARKGPVAGPWVSIDVNAERLVQNKNLGDIASTTRYFLSDISLSPGDQIHMYYEKDGPANVIPARATYKLRKIS